MTKACASCFLVTMLLSACAAQPGRPAADRQYDCTDGNGSIGILVLTAKGEALIQEPATTTWQTFGTYEERADAIVIHNKDFGAITYRNEDGKLISTATVSSWTNQITCVARK